MEDIELWDDVVGYEGLYEVSNTGKVRSLNHRKGRVLIQHLDRKDGSERGDGRFKVDLYNGGDRKTCKVHRLVAEAFCEGKCPEKNEVNHKDLNCKNNHYTNLEWCDRQHNANNRKRTGKITRICNKFNPKWVSWRVCYTPTLKGKQIVKQFKTEQLAIDYLASLKT